MLVSEGKYIMAYSVLSTLETLVLVMIPVSTFLYKTVGMVWLMLINSACFCTAAIFETQISDVEGKNGQSGSSSGPTAQVKRLEPIRHRTGDAAHCTGELSR